MAFWNNIGQKASETTAKAVQKAKEMSDIARLNSMISADEDYKYLLSDRKTLCNDARE